MSLFILSYLAGALTIFAPSILPVVPFVFARVDQPFVRRSQANGKDATNAWPASRDAHRHTSRGL